MQPELQENYPASVVIYLSGFKGLSTSYGLGWRMVLMLACMQSVCVDFQHIFWSCELLLLLVTGHRHLPLETRFTLEKNKALPRELEIRAMSGPVLLALHAGPLS